MRIFYSSKFEREYKRLSLEIQEEAKKKTALFRKNPHDSNLKTHKLKGKFHFFWSFSVTQKHRIVFRFVNKEIIYFHSIGDHNVYQ